MRYCLLTKEIHTYIYSRSQREHAGDPSTWKLRQEEYGCRAPMGYLAGCCLRERARGREQSLGDSSIGGKVPAQEDLGSTCRTQIKMSVECPVLAIPGLERGRPEAPWDSMPSQSGLIGELHDTEGLCFKEVATGGYSQLPLT